MTARSAVAWACLGEFIPPLGYFLVCCAELLCELIDKLIGRTQTAPAADLKSNHRLPQARYSLPARLLN